MAGVEQVTAPEPAASTKAAAGTAAAGPGPGEPGPPDPDPAAGTPAEANPAHPAGPDGQAGGGEPPTYRARHARRRAKWPWFVAGCLVIVLLAAGAAMAVISRRDADHGGAATLSDRSAPPAGIAPGANLSAVPGTGGSGGEANGAPAVECRYEKVSGESVTVVPQSRPNRGGPVGVTIGTNRGTITLELDADRAPCTVQSFLTLATANYFTDSACHRVTTAMIFVVQCGDPTATGSGGPGYRFDDENLPTAPGYPRGTIAMANAGPNTNGGQFFLVYRDSPIDPNYPVFGRVTGGLEILDAVAAAGAPNDDGPPNLELIIVSVRIG